MDQARPADESLIEWSRGYALRPSPRKPTVSVIIPAYNAADYIGEALSSVFAQTFSDFEVIVVNDGSPDTERFERAIEPYRDRIVYLRQENRGPSAARNLAIRTARGEYVAFLDSDDSWLPEYLAEQLKIFEANPLLDLVYCDAMLHGDRALAAGKTFMQVCPSKGAVTFQSLLVEDCQVVTSGTVAKRRAVIEAGLFDERFFRSEDHDLWMRLAYQGCRIAYHEKVLVRHRLHPSSLAASNEKLLADQIEVLRKLKRTLQLPPETKSLLQKQVTYYQASLDLEEGKRQLLMGRVEQGGQLLARANVFFHRTDLTLVLLGLRFAPRLTVFVIRIRLS